jgi:hypothetical protein
VGHPIYPFLTAIDLLDGAATNLDLPRGISTMRSYNVDYAGRVTGDLTVSPDGRLLAVPVLYVDNQPSESGTQSPNNLSGGTVVGYYEEGATLTPGNGRFQPSITLQPLDDLGGPKIGRALPYSAMANTRDHDGQSISARSYISSLTFSPDQSLIAAPMEASDTVLFVRTPVVPVGASGRGLFKTTSITAVHVDPGPSDVIWIDADQAVIRHTLDHALTEIAFEDSENGLVFEEIGPVSHPFTPATDSQVELGRRLFTSAVDSRIGSPIVGVSCSTCHFDGRTDGLTWSLDLGDRQTPSLAGVISETTPLTWTEGVESVADEAELTSQLLMGADPDLYDRQLYEAIAVFVDTTRHEVNPVQDPEAITRGAVLFFQDEVACGDCHLPPLYTDNQAHDLYNLEDVVTPSLLGVSATAPYIAQRQHPELGGAFRAQHRRLDGRHVRAG